MWTQFEKPSLKSDPYFGQNPLVIFISQAQVYPTIKCYLALSVLQIWLESFLLIIYAIIYLFRFLSNAYDVVANKGRVLNP